MIICQKYLGDFMTKNEIKELINKSGMDFVAAFDAFTFNEPNEKSERICIVAMEKGK